MKNVAAKLKNLVSKGFLGAMLTCTIGSNEIASTVGLTTIGALAAGGVGMVYKHSTKQAAKTNASKMNSVANTGGGE